MAGAPPVPPPAPADVLERSFGNGVPRTRSSAQHEHLFAVKRFDEQVFAIDPTACTVWNISSFPELCPPPAPAPASPGTHKEPTMPRSKPLTARQREILDFIEQQINERGYPPSVREIGEAVGLTSPSTVHTHLLTLQRLGYLRRDPTKPAGHRGPLRPHLGCGRARSPPGAPRAAGRRRGRRHERAGPGERRGGAAVARRLHRRRRAVHAAGPGQLDDRRRHPRRRLHRGPRPDHRGARRDRRGRHPRRRGDCQDLLAPGRAGRAAAIQPARSSRWCSIPTTWPCSAGSSR